MLKRQAASIIYSFFEAVYLHYRYLYNKKLKKATLVTKGYYLKREDQTGITARLAFSFKNLIFKPLAFMMQILLREAVFEVYTICLPEGDQEGDSLSALSKVNWIRLLPSVSIEKIWYLP